ncbi:hypothetical protein ABXJ76_07920 [Methylobacter sp. G7]|uniref:hypothetical protein n=1 Tax=Methylobacter sp. G7 TaxID=3230117 RepID=UPI003D805B51
MNNQLKTLPFNIVAHYAGRPLTLVIDEQHHTYLNLRQLAAILNQNNDEAAQNPHSATGYVLAGLMVDSIKVFGPHNGLQFCYLEANRIYAYLRNMVETGGYSHLTPGLLDWLCEQVARIEDGYRHPVAAIQGE